MKRERGQFEGNDQNIPSATGINDVDALTPNLIEALAEIEEFTAEQDDAKKRDKPVGPPLAKKARGTADNTRTRPALSRVPSILTPQAHELPAMAVVKLRPSIELESGRISEVVISAGHRTPSPYGSRMGDHTVAWAVIVDSLRARLFGRTLIEAVGVLRDHHFKVGGWMPDRNSTVKKLLLMLRHPEPDRSVEERIERVRRLEDAAYQVEQHLLKATELLGAMDPAPDVLDLARQQLESAIGQHLSYVNYLPFATVRSSVDRSIGSAEGHYRSVVLRVESPGVPETVDAEPDEDPGEAEAADESLAQAAGLVEDEEVLGEDVEEEEEDAAPRPVPLTRTVVREALWRLFSFEAAIRAADMNLALRPLETGEQVSTLNDTLAGWADQVAEQLKRYIPGGKAKSTADLALVRQLRDKAQAEAERLLKRPDAKGLPSDNPLWRLADRICDVANHILQGQPRTKIMRERMLNTLYGLYGQASGAATDLAKQQKTAIDDAASILAYLIHEHQRSVAVAYPAAVRDSCFLSPAPVPDVPLPLAAATGTAPVPATPVQVPKADPAAAALERLETEIRRSPNLTLPGPAKPDEKSTLDLFLEAFGPAYTALRDTPVTGEPNGWATHRKNRNLVVSHDPGMRAKGLPTITVNGRAAAPPGVAGMGSHTTAWAVEEAATDALASVPDSVIADFPHGVLDNFSETVATDLRSAVMTLDVYLPSAQLAGGQLEQLFDAAARVRRATTVSAAATAYLGFRNLLPFATVDAGSRGGHGENLAAPMEKLFDAGSLADAAELQAEALADSDGRKEAITALADSATGLLAMSKRTWMKDTVVREAVLACAARLKAYSDVLTAGAPDGKVDKIILATRWLAHKATYKDACSSQMMVNALADAQTV